MYINHENDCEAVKCRKFQSARTHLLRTKSSVYVVAITIKNYNLGLHDVEHVFGNVP